MATKYSDYLAMRFFDQIDGENLDDYENDPPPEVKLKYHDYAKLGKSVYPELERRYWVEFEKRLDALIFKSTVPQGLHIGFD